MCLTLCDPIVYSLPGSSIPGIFQARILEWVAISFSRGNLPNPGIEPWSPALQEDSLWPEPPWNPSKKKRTLKRKDFWVSQSLRINTNKWPKGLYHCGLYKNFITWNFTKVSGWWNKKKITWSNVHVQNLVQPRFNCIIVLIDTLLKMSKLQF